MYITGILLILRQKISLLRIHLEIHFSFNIKQRFMYSLDLLLRTTSRDYAETERSSENDMIDGKHIYVRPLKFYITG